MLVVILTYVATKGQVLYGTALLFTYAIGHCLLMLAAGTYTGFVESFVQAKGIVNFSVWTNPPQDGLRLYHTEPDRCRIFYHLVVPPGSCLQIETK